MTGGGAALPPQPEITAVSVVGVVPQLGTGSVLVPGIDAMLWFKGCDAQELVTVAGTGAADLAAAAALSAACFCAANMASLSSLLVPASMMPLSVPVKNVAMGTMSSKNF